VHGAEAHGAEVHGAEAHGAEAHGAEAHGAEAHGAEAHGAEAHGAEAHGAEAHEAFLLHIEVVDVKSSSWGPADGRLAGPHSLACSALEQSVRTGRGGLGVVHVFAAGNGGARDNVNNDGYANSIYTIAVSAVSADGVRPWYTEPGCCILVCAPSSGAGYGLVTTDASPAGFGYSGPSAYTASFGYTSAAAPQVAGVVALMLQANPALGWRDMQEVLIASATQVDASGPPNTPNAVPLDSVTVDRRAWARGTEHPRRCATRELGAARPPDTPNAVTVDCVALGGTHRPQVGARSTPGAARGGGARVPVARVLRRRQRSHWHWSARGPLVVRQGSTALEGAPSRLNQWHRLASGWTGHLVPPCAGSGPSTSPPRTPVLATSCTSVGVQATYHRIVPEAAIYGAPSTH